MKYLSGSIVARIAGACLLAAGLTSAAQTTTTQVMTVRSQAAGVGKPAAAVTTVQTAPNGTRYKKVVGQSSRTAVTTQTVKATIVQGPAAKVTATSKTSGAKAEFRPRPHFAPAPTVVTAQNFGNATIGSTPVTMTLNYPVDATSPGASSVVAGGGVAPGSASDYIFFGNSNVEFGQGGGGQPSNLTNFTVSTLNNVEYPGNGNYTSITAPGGSSPFTTGTVVENPTNYPNTTPHTTLLATFSPLNAGSFTVYILDGNTDGVVVGNSSVGLGVNGGAAVVTASHFLSGTNEFTRYNVANASPSDVFQVYATTSTNSYPTIGGLTFVMGTSSGTSGGGLTAATTANQDFQVSSTNCTGSTCSVQVTFTPGFPGLRYDALTLTDSDGNMVYQTYLYGLGMGPQFGYEIGNYTEYDGYLTSPLGVALGPDDLVYFTQTGSNIITKSARDFSSSNQITLNGLATPSGIAVDGSNTLYVADQTNNVIFSYSAAGVQGTVTTSPLNGPSQLAIDGTGALYIADTGNGRIIKIDNQGNETTLASGLSSPTSVAVDSNGNVFFADSANNGEILELAAGASSPTTYTSQMNLTVMNMAVDASDSIYVTTNQGIAFYRNGGQDGIFYASGVDIPVGLAVERNGDVFQTNPLKNIFSINDRSSSNFILNTAPNTTANGSYPIYNTGNTPLTVTGFSITGPEFQIANSPPQCTPPQVIAPAMSCTVNINFTPPLAQYYTDTAIATSNSLNMPGTTDPFYLAGSGTGAPSTTTLSAAPSQVQDGSPVELLVTVSDSPMTFTPSGPVTFMEGSNVLGTAMLSPGVLADTATATLTLSSISGGMHTYTAAFPGDANVSPSTSSNLTVTGYPAGSPPNGSVGTVNFGNQTLGGAATTSVTFPQNTAQVTSTNTEFSSIAVAHALRTWPSTRSFPGCGPAPTSPTTRKAPFWARCTRMGLGLPRFSDSIRPTLPFIPARSARRGRRHSVRTAHSILRIIQPTKSSLR
jgi:Bacterial Ig-like domain (group 3)